MLEEICCGDQSAAQFCDAFVRWCDWIDDAVDKDHQWDADAAIRVNLAAVVVFSGNEFFQRNKNFLAPLILQSFRAFGDSIEWSKRKSRRDRRAADVFKSYYYEVFWHVAYLCAAAAGKDGWQHMSAVTAKYRHVDYDFKE